jgi:hypothetical protein
MVKCYYCGEKFDRDKVACVPIGRRYAHLDCAKAHGGYYTEEREVATVTIEKKEEEKDMPTQTNSNMVSMINTMQEFMLKTIAESNTDALWESVMPAIEKRVMEKYGCIPERHEIVTSTETHQIDGVLHEKFDDVLKVVSLDIPVYLTGKAGTGKNVICKQVAEALGLEFYFTNAVTQEYKLTGFIDANGVYQETQFYKAFTNGGVFFLDEMDASIPEVLIILNAAIANKYFDFPNGKVEAHPNFRVIAAGNTLGTGADNNYTGRYCLDRASLDRFALIHIDYSPKIELAMAFNKTDLVDFCHAFRAATEEAGIDCLFSYRTINRIAKLEDVFDNLGQVIGMSLLKGISSDDLTIISSTLSRVDGMGKNKYAKALKALIF